MKKAIAVITLAAILVIFIINGTFGRSIKCINPQNDVYEDKYDFMGIYLFDESVLYEGMVDDTYMYAENGQKVSNGSKIAKGITSDMSGMLYMGLDGYEGIYTRNNLNEITGRDIKNVIKAQTKDGIKVIDNSLWYMYILIDGAPEDCIEEGMSKKLVIEGKYYSADILNVYSKDEGIFALVEFQTDPDIIDLRRGVTGYIIKSSYEGMIIPESAVCKRDDSDGVYINYNGYTAFRRVELLYKGKGIAVVTSSDTGQKLSKYDSVVKDARKIKSGMRIR